MIQLILLHMLVAPVGASQPLDGHYDEPAPAFEATDLEGRTIDLAGLRGKVVLLNFWGVWCTSCRQEIPELVALDTELREQGLVILGADYGDAPEALPPFVEEFGMTYPVLLDEGLEELFEVIVFPTSVIIDRRGHIRYRVLGYRPERFEEMTTVVKALLAERP